MEKRLQIGFLYRTTAMPRKAQGFSVLKLDQTQSRAVELRSSGTSGLSAELHRGCWSEHTSSVTIEMRNYLFSVFGLKMRVLGPLGHPGLSLELWKWFSGDCQKAKPPLTG